MIAIVFGMALVVFLFVSAAFADGVAPDRSTGRFAGDTGAFTLMRLADAATGVTGITAGLFEGMISLDH